MAKTFYYFNPSTLSFEKAEFKFKDFIKRTLWLIATALAFALVFVWISFYVIDSPKERMLQRENNELKQQLKQTAKKINMLEIVLQDIQDRDDQVYRSIFEAEPVPIELRNPVLSQNRKYEYISENETLELLNIISEKVDLLTLRIDLERKSLDTVMSMVKNKSDMLQAIPAIRPIKNMYNVTSGFGRRYHPILKILRMHTGIDIAAPRGTPVYATADGVVSREAAGSGYGITVILNHGYSYKTVYAHLSKRAVRPGQKVKRGEIIGYVGSTGLSMGSHLHYEVLKGGIPVNPVHYFFSDITPQEYEAILESSKKINQALS
ncbi:MAG TPA: peptidoglycan DD-metalloendopeptidase family protein [Bacteroidales bacterium]|nr:peptidoglycan DD-metalloendopeptidase family protein [Bacteroidales bacterium]HQQ21546.1 peptidoglycan DD-metalloendopeptidase family protein [Bacteroidales bacterium]